MTSNLPAQYQPNVLAAQMEYAKALAMSSMLPRQYQGQPANLLWAISYGQTLGVDPMTAVQSIHVINGKPTASADLIAGLVRRAGHKLRVSGDDKKAVAQVIRADDPEFTYEVVWTIERANAAKLTGKDTWKQFPAAMLKARAITEVARAACSEILQGTIYTPEEMGAVVDQDGNPVDAPVQPLQVVRHQEVPAQAAPAAPEVSSAAQEFADGAAKATTRAEWRQKWALAATGRLLDAPVKSPDTGDVEPFRSYMTRRGSELPPEQPTAEDIPDADITPDTPALSPLEELRAAAQEAGLTEADLEEGFQAAYGTPTDQATDRDLQAMTATLRRGAA